jgi:hypothetical protein
MPKYELDPAISEDDFRVIARERLARQDQDFQDTWLPAINDNDPYGRLMAYTAVWTAMQVGERWQQKIDAELQGMAGTNPTFTPEEIAKGEEITRYYQNLDPNDPANWPDDDETKTQPPFPSIKEHGNES